MSIRNRIQWATDLADGGGSAVLTRKEMDVLRLYRQGILKGWWRAEHGLDADGGWTDFIGGIRMVPVDPGVAPIYTPNAGPNGAAALVLSNDPNPGILTTATSTDLGFWQKASDWSLVALFDPGPVAATAKALVSANDYLNIPFLSVTTANRLQVDAQTDTGSSPQTAPDYVAPGTFKIVTFAFRASDAVVQVRAGNGAVTNLGALSDAIVKTRLSFFGAKEQPPEATLGVSRYRLPARNAKVVFMMWVARDLVADAATWATLYAYFQERYPSVAP